MSAGDIVGVVLGVTLLGVFVLMAFVGLTMWVRWMWADHKIDMAKKEAELRALTQKLNVPDTSTSDGRISLVKDRK